MRRFGTLVLLLAAGCTGSISQDRSSTTPGAGGAAPGGGAGTSVPTGQGSGGSGGSGPASASCGADTVPAARVWRLTNTQYKNTATAVFGYTGPSTDQLPADARPDGFSNEADRLSVTPLLASTYLTATDEIATNVVANSGQFIKCPLASLGAGTCLQDFLTSVGARAWRRPLTQTEIAKYTTLFNTVAQDNGPDGGLKAVVQALMLSPNFTFRTELGSGGAAGTTTNLTDYELASSLSYMLVDQPPDATLTQLASAGKLHDPATLAAQAKRLFANAQQASTPVVSFFQQWLQFDDLPGATKDANLFPTYTPDVASDLLAENRAFVNSVLFDPAGDGTAKTLLSATYSFLDSRTAPIYGVQATGTTPVRTDLPAAQRRGLFTEAAFIAAASDPDDTNLPSRGRIVREQLLCQVVAPPPGNFQFDPTKITPDMTNREKFVAHTVNPACATCHVLFDGIGFALEQYDPIGQFRTMDKGKVIDPSGSLPLPSGMLQFSSYIDLADQLVKGPDTYACMASQYEAYSTGFAPSQISQCENDRISKAFASGGYRFDALLSAIVTSPVFATRQN